MTTARPKGNVNAKLWFFFKILLAVVLFAYVLSKTDYVQLLALKERFSWGWFGVSFITFLLMVATKTYQHYFFIGRKLNYFRTLHIVVVQNLLMNFVATLAGIASYLTMLGVEKDVRLGKATETFILVKIGDVVAVAMYLLLSVFFIRPIPDGAVPIMVFVMIFLLFFGLVLFAAIFFRDKFLVVLTSFIKYLKLKDVSIIKKTIGYLEKISAYPRKNILRTIIQASLISFAYMGLTMLWGYARFQSFSMHLDFFVVVFVFSMLQFASWIPIYVFGGLGLSEGMSIYLFSLFSVNGTELAAVLIAIRVLAYLLNASLILYIPLINHLEKSSISKGVA